MKRKITATKKRALFIFRRDLRLFDNIGLIDALQTSEKVIPAFIFTPKQIYHNPLRSDRCLQFMIECIEDLNRQISSQNGKLFVFYGDPVEIVTKCIRQLHVERVVVNMDYTVYSRERDKEIENVCLANLVEFDTFEDALLHPVTETLKPDSAEPYTVFTPFYKRALALEVSKPRECKFKNFFNGKIDFALEDEQKFYRKILPERFKQLEGGRGKCLEILNNLERFKRYAEEKDILAKSGTTRLSAHLKFTTCSTREIYHVAARKLGGKNCALIRQLFWRDFYTQLAYHFPKVFVENFREKYNALQWITDKSAFERWCQGQTGFPIVDAGMRELNETGYMHNRARMITASFLVKDLHLDWRLGEKYFATHLVDYDPCVNNGNWQWCASTGCDPQPYFRVFNPWLQSAKFDPDCVYIKRWLPELSDVPSAKLHKWYMDDSRKMYTKINYPAPMCDHGKESKVAIEMFKKC